MRFAAIAIVASVVFSVPISASALPLDPGADETGVSGCVTRAGSTFFDCEVFEGPDEITTLPLPTIVSTGVVALLETAAGGNGVDNWSDLAVFTNTATTGLLTFYSDGAAVDFSSFTPAVFLVEDPSGVTAYFSGGTRGVNNDYFFHSAADTVSEPGALPLFGIGLTIGLAGLLWRRSRQISDQNRLPSPCARRTRSISTDPSS